MKRTIVVIVAVIVVASLSLGIDLYERSSPQPAKELGPGLVLSIAPASTGLNAAPAEFLYASVQIFVNPPPSVATWLHSYVNVAPLFNGTTNSTGYLVTNLSYGFYSLADNWTSYIAEVSYYYIENNTTMVYYQSVVVPFNPAFYVLLTGNFLNVTEIYGYHHLSNITFQDHPSLASMKGYVDTSSTQYPSIV